MVALEGCFEVAVVETEVASEEAGAWIVVALEGAGEEDRGAHQDLSWSRWEAEAADGADQEKWTSMYDWGQWGLAWLAP